MAPEGRSGDKEYDRGAGFSSGIKEATTQTLHSKLSSEEMGCPYAGEALVPEGVPAKACHLKGILVHGRRGQQAPSVKCQMGNILGLLGHAVSTQLLSSTSVV